MKIFKNILKKNFFFFLILLFIFTITRIDILSIHWGHGDDVGIGHTVFSLLQKFDINLLNERLSQENKKFEFLKYLINSNLLNIELIKKLLIPFAISENSTYPPLHTYFVSFFGNFDLNYRLNIISTRVGTALVSILTYILIFLLFSKIKNKNENFNFYGLFIICFSWMFLVYSSLSHFMVYIVLSSVIFFLIILSEQKISIYKSIFFGFLFVTLTLFNYQTIIFFPAFFLTIFYLNDFSIKNFYKFWGACFIITFIGTIFIYLHYMQSIMAVHWNVGPRSEFAFLCFEKNGFYLFSCSIIFLFKNFFLVLKSIVSFSDIEKPLSNLYSYGVLFFTCCSFLNFRSISKSIKSIIVFSFITFIFWFVLIFLQKAAMAPTRHSLFILLPISILFSIGIMNVGNLIVKRFIYHKIISLFFLITTFFFIISYFHEREKRIDPYLKINLEDIISEYNVSKIVSYDWSWGNLIYYNFINKNFNYSPGPFFKYHNKFYDTQEHEEKYDCKFCRTSMIYNSKILSDGNIMFISHRRIDNELQKNKLFYSLLNFINSENKNEYNIKDPETSKNIEYFLIKNTNPVVLNKIYNYEYHNNTELDFGNLTRNGSNNLIIDIYKIK